ncbi:MAG: ATP-binding cassette domain-containing protein, partial [Longicatena sp.]|nr:ATP-binding cassette domain-containing protein [Longicatena sp.]
MYAIETKNLTKYYKNVIAVQNLNLKIKQGELFALLGMNGAGKTTTIKMLCGLSKATSGDAYVGGYHINHDLQEVKKRIALSPQENAIAPNLTVSENLAFICQ